MTRNVSDETLVAMLQQRLRAAGAFQLFALALGPKDGVHVSMLRNVDARGNAERLVATDKDLASALLTLLSEENHVR